MSKPSTSRLTASRKKRPGADWRDAVDDHCFRLDMMAELLQACGEPLEPGVLESVGHWVSQEVEAVRALLNELERRAR